MIRKSFFRSFPLFALFLSLPACKKSRDSEVWIYTSTYKEVVATYDEALKKDLPDISIRWFQQGSENVAAKVITEESAGGTKADLIMTSDLFFFQDLKKNGKLFTLTPDLLEGVPADKVDPDQAFIVNRFPVVVIAYNKSVLKEADRPKSFEDLMKPKYKGKITMPSPLESGSAMVGILYLYKIFGAEFFKALRGNETLATGGNGAAMSRIQSGEKSVGIVLMENVLQAKEKGNDSVDFLIPSEGALAIPSPFAIVKNSNHLAAAQKVFKWFATPKAQDLLIKGWCYSSFAGVKAPNGGPEMKDMKLQPWDFKTFEQWGAQKQAVKDAFQELVLK